MSIFNFVHLLSSSPSCITPQKLNDVHVCKYYAYQMAVPLMKIIPTCFELRVRYDWQGTTSNCLQECCIRTTEQAEECLLGTNCLSVEV